MKKKLKTNSIIMIVISCLILLLLSIYVLNEQNELAKLILVINIVCAYVINIPAILSGIFSILYTNGIKLNILSIIFSVIHIFFQILFVLFMFIDPLRFFGGPTSIFTISTYQILLIIVLVISGIPSLINIILLHKHNKN